MLWRSSILFRKKMKLSGRSNDNGFLAYSYIKGYGTKKYFTVLLGTDHIPFLVGE